MARVTALLLIPSCPHSNPFAREARAFSADSLSAFTLLRACRAAVPLARRGARRAEPPFRADTRSDRSRSRRRSIVSYSSDHWLMAHGEDYGCDYGLGCLRPPALHPCVTREGRPRQRRSAVRKLQGSQYFPVCQCLCDMPRGPGLALRGCCCVLVFLRVLTDVSINSHSSTTHTLHAVPTT